MTRTAPVILSLVFCFMPHALIADDDSDGAKRLPDDIAALVDRLDAADWRTRNDAMLALMEVAPDWLEALRIKSQSGISIEAGLRLRRAAEELYLSRQIGPAPACLGIQHTQSVEARYDSRVAPGLFALRVDIVFPNTAAARAGLRPGDLIIGMNGRIASSNEECNSFTSWIFNQKPGTPCEFTVLRNIKGRSFRPAFERGIDRRGFRRLETRVVSGSEDGRLADAAVGLLVTISPSNDTRLDLQPGDLIVGLDGKRLPAENPKQALEDWTNEGDALKDTSIQVLRGGQRVRLKATLGRWPLYLAAGRNGIRRGADRDRIIELSSEFEQWWRLPASPDTSDAPPPRDPSFFWQMEP
ncbi:MAG: hypothetical protein H6819_09825 [Phycisphaerales bacterium]|nr:hypothetical protein [Phycisphaerales bacterium]MCB9857946.1 hypothetical protein [Phycisphaerales bacterium]